MRKLIYILLAAFMVQFSSCSRHKDNGLEPERPAVGPITGTEADPELDDASVRIKGNALNLRFDDCGIIFSKSADGIVSGTRLIDGIGFDYDPAIPSLMINGVALKINSAKVVKTQGATRWHMITEYDGVSKIYIVEDL